MFTSLTGGVSRFWRRTGLHLAVQRCRSVQDEALDLQELIWLVAAHYRETEATAALFQLGVDKVALQLRAVASEERLPS